ncbi:L,D-transpeptidase [Mycoplasma sp. P36-A1]|uniref:L,D-transpeptidase n=1 Tax=Mycoplasma sp. P36-A1 TaxID=3252900 RepID=UPI003C2F69CB
MKKENSKRSKKIMVVLLVVFGAALIIYGAGYVYASTNTLPNTKLYGQNLASYDENSLNKVVENEKLTLKLKDKRKEIIIPVKELDYKITNLDSITSDIISSQEPLKWPISIVQGQDFSPIKIKVNEASLDKALTKYKVVSNNGLTKSKDATFALDKDNGKIKVNEEVVGEQLDSKLVKKTINEGLANGVINIDLNKAIVMPNVFSSQLKSLVNEVEEKLDNNVNLKVVSNDYMISPSKQERLKWISLDSKNNKVIIEKNAIRNYLKSVNKSFISNTKDTDTVYRVLGNGKVEKVSDGKAVEGVDEYALTAMIYDSLTNNYNLDENVEAVTISQPKISYEGHDSVDDNLVEVSISKQMVYLYNKGKLILSTPVVTGMNGKHDTPKGKFTIMYKTTNFTLRGDAYGYDYALPVKYWMPFEGGNGVGLHDAPWRKAGTFGGNYYLNDGSHGCINMIHADVATIYSYVSAGTAVWVH